jgi:L-alanine-DL-glutamate epimerase-like enolase superfamily enzyme
MPAARYTGPEEPATRDIEIVRLTLANGAEGVGCCDTTSVGQAVVVHEIRDLSAKVLGQAVSDRTSLTESLLADAGEGPWYPISIIDCAMWDAYAYSEGKPLWQLLGGQQARIQTYASTDANLTVQEYLDDIEKYAALGYPAIKLHLNTDPDFDLELVHAVASAYRDSALRFMVDIEECYEFDAAMRLGEALDKGPFDWMEAPLPDTDIDAYVQLNKAVAIDVLPAGNTLFGIQHWTEGLRRGAWSRLRTDATYAGGITEALKAMALARSMGAPVELQAFGFQPTQHANLAVMLGVGGCTWFEHPAPREPYDYATLNPLILGDDGCVAAADGPGLAIDIEWERIAADAHEIFDTHE